MLKSFLLVLENITVFYKKKMSSLINYDKIPIKIVLFHAYLKFQWFRTKKWNVLGHLNVI